MKRMTVLFGTVLALGLLVTMSQLAYAQDEPSATTANPVVNVAHLAPFGETVADTSVTIRINGSDVFTEVLYSDIVPGINILPGGIYTVEIVPTGTVTPAISKVVTLTNDMQYSLIAVGDNSYQPLDLLVLTDDTSAPAAGQAKLRIGHLAPFASDAGAATPAAGTAVDICNDDTGLPLLTNVVFGQVSPYLPVNAGLANLSIAAPGGTCATKLLDLPTLQLNSGSIYDAFAIGKNTSVYPLNVTSITGLDVPAEVTVGHFAPFATTVAGTAVDIRVNSQTALTDVVFGDFFPNLTIPSGPVLVEVVVPDANAAATTETIALSETFTLTGGSSYNLFAIGGANGADLAFSATEISKTAPAGSALFTIGHLAPFAANPVDNTAVTICTDDGVAVPGLSGITYPAVAANLTLPPGPYNLQVRLGNDCTGAVALDLAPFRLAAGDVRNVFATGLNNAAFPLQAVSTTGLGPNEYLPIVFRQQTIVQVAASNPDFSTLVTLLQAAGLDETLSGPGPFTVFAPTNDAFAKLPQATLDALLADPTGDLTQILLYHVLGEELMASQISDGLTKATVQGSNVSFSVQGNTVKIDDATITATDIIASNGVIHVIDTVLMPPMLGTPPMQPLQ